VMKLTGSRLCCLIPIQAVRVGEGGKALIH
jgi:hypothetical protein